MNRKTSFRSSIMGLAFAIFCLFISIVVLWALPVGQNLRPILLQETKSTPINITYVVAHSSSQFKQLWAISRFWDSYATHHAGVHLAATGEHAFLLGGLDENKIGNLTMTKLDLLTGGVKWVRFDSSPNNGAATTIGANSNRVFVGFDGTQKISGNTTWGTGKVIAYDKNTGDMVWFKTISGARGIETLVVTDSTISVDGAFSANYYLLDPETGDTLDVREKKSPHLIWFVNNGIVYERQESFSFQARDEKTNEIIWQSEVGYPVLQPPIQTDKAIVARSGEAGFLGTAFAVDGATGGLIWEYKDVLSNVSVDRSTAFFLTKDVKLIAIDIETGKILGQVAFTPGVTRDRASNIHYFVAASNDIVLIYLGDSRQLFAFRFLPDNLKNFTNDNK